MSRLVLRPVEVRLGASGYPEAVSWREGRRARWRRVRCVLDAWREAGAWWDGEGERLVFRLLLVDGLLVEVERWGEAGWRLYRIHD